MNYILHFRCFSVESKTGVNLLPMLILETYVRQSLVSDSVSMSPISFERLCINISFGCSQLRLLAFYRAPDPLNLTDFLDELDTTLANCTTKTMIVGDINIGVPNLSGQTLPLDASSHTYIDLLNSYGFAISNSHPTRPASGKTLDHFVTNFHDTLQILNHTLEVDPKLTNHSIVISTVTFKSSNPRQIDCVSRPHLNFKALDNNLPEFSTICDCSDPNQIADSLTCALQLSIERSTTIKNFVVKHSDRSCK